MNSSIIVQLLGLVAALALIMGFTSKSSSTENFINVPRKVMADPLVRNRAGQVVSSRNFNSQNNTYSMALKRASRNQAEMAIKKAVDPSGFVSVANYQQNVLNKIAPMGYTPYIKYKMPPSNMLGVLPENPNPLDYTKMVKENYGGRVSSPKKAAPEYLSTEDLMPSQTMETVGLSGQVGDTYQTDRLMYSNSKVRTQLDSDFIRGDLAIVPAQNQGWFQSRYANATNLRPGALAALGGANNENAKNLSKLVSAYSGTAPSAFAGSPITGAVSKELGVGPHRESLQVTAFP
jgi:hypothetical protein